MEKRGGEGLVQVRAGMRVVGTSCLFCRWLELRLGRTGFESFSDGFIDG